MYAIIRAGGVQHKVATGDVIEINRLKDSSGTIEFTPLLVVGDDGSTRTGGDLAGATVKGTVVGESKGPKIDIFKYRNKTGYRRRAGHRQPLTRVEIGDIVVSSGGGRASQEG